MVIKEKTVEKAIKGDKEALHLLLRAEKEKLYRTAYSYVRKETDALDIFQETVLHAIESIHQLREPKYFSTWLMRICINISINMLRTEKNIISLEIDKNQPISTTFINSEEKMDLLNAIYQLDEKYKTVLLLKYYEDLTYEQIAELLNEPIGTVKSNGKRALEKLKSKLKGVYIDERKSIY